MNKLLIIGAAVATIAANAATSASAQTVAYTQNPIHVVRYSVQSAYLTPMPVWGGTNPGGADFSELAITFVNTGAVPATAVRFVVHTGTTTEIIADNGTFAPGTSITHDFPIGSAFAGATVDVQNVTFADGTSWTRG